MGARITARKDQNFQSIMTKQNEDISGESNEPTVEAVEETQAQEASAETNEPILTDLEKVQAEAADMKSRYLRSVADMENYRKRIAREKQDIIRSAAANVVESLLPVLDNMKLGLQAAENHPEAKDVTVGFKMVDEQLKKSLSEQGLEELVPHGEVFDPNIHECIAQQTSDEIKEDHVIQTVRAGYRLNDRLIRAANVIVSSGPTKEKN
ncbi:MAG: nucleotide exchange factor GrpE [Puniceicoccaceae bacterium]|nr:nucleotide exchange factor GrpE [Puniceicoccaceae bacterium]